MAVFKRFIVERKVSLSIMLVSLLVYSWLLAVIVPTFLGNANLSKLFESYPKSLLIFLTGGGNVNIFTAEGFLSLEYFSLWWIILIGGVVLAMASAIIGKEIEKGTAEVLLTLPISRNAFLFFRLIATLIVIIFLVFFNAYSFYFLGKIYDFHLSLRGLLYVSIYGFLVFSLMATLTLALSMFFPERSKSISIVAAFFFANHILNSLGDVYKNYKWIKPFTLFHYYHPYDALRGKFSPDILVFVVASLLLTALSFVVFSRKDITV